MENQKKMTSADGKKSVDDIGRSMSRAIKSIAGQDEKIADHFNKCIPNLYTTPLSYRPDRDIDWHT